MSKRKKRYRGHFCWCCGKIQPNERFSANGHKPHLCRDCSHLGKEKLDHRQKLRNLDRLVTREGIIPRKRRQAFEKFLSHPDARIRQYAQELAAIDAEERKLQRALKSGIGPEEPDDGEICDSVASDEPTPDWFVKTLSNNPCKRTTISHFETRPLDGPRHESHGYRKPHTSFAGSMNTIDRASRKG